MSSPSRRAVRRARCVEIALFVLKHEPNGLAVSDLAQLINRTSRYDVTASVLGQLLKETLSRGLLRTDFNERGNIVYYYTGE
tara:strand:+ start:2409 stop:2654 length:246 start_codon:yes stop_codon:yes gene_type:complete